MNVSIANDSRFASGHAFITVEDCPDPGATPWFSLRRASGCAETLCARHAAINMNISFLIIYILVVCSFSVIPVQFYFTMTSIEPGRRRVMPSGPTAVTREI